MQDDDHGDHNNDDDDDDSGGNSSSPDGLLGAWVPVMPRQGLTSLVDQTLCQIHPGPIWLLLLAPSSNLSSTLSVLWHI